MKQACFLLTIMLLTSCISTYKTINCSSANYNNVDSGNNQNITVLTSADNILSANKRFNKKAKKKEIQVVPICIENSDTDTLYFSTNKLVVFNNFELVELLTAKYVTRKIGYNIPARSALFAICVVGSFNISGGAAASVSILNPYSPFLYATPFSAYYLTNSIISNKKFKRDLYSMFYENEPIAPGDKLYGVIAFEAAEVNNIMIRFKQ